MDTPELDATLSDLAAASTVLARALAASRESWAPDPPPPTAVMGDLGSALVAAIDELDDGAIARVAAAIERGLEHPSDLVKDAVATGLIEAAMAATVEEPAGARFLRELGPRALAYARDWDTFGGLRTPGVWE